MRFASECLKTSGTRFEINFELLVGCALRKPHSAPSNLHGPAAINLRPISEEQLLVRFFAPASPSRPCL